MNKTLKLIISHFPDGQFSTTQEDLDKYGRDWYQGLVPNASAVFFPESEDDIVKIFQLSNEHEYKLVISGGRTGLSGGATAINQEIVISSERLKKMSWNEDSNQITCQAGVVTDEAKSLAALNKRILPIEFSSTSSSTIGGNIATNAAGARYIRYGATKEHVRGLKVIMPDGAILSFQNQIEKDATGPDIMELFYGSEGVMGFIFEAILQTYPVQEHKESVLIRANQLDQVNKLIEDERRYISAVEFIDGNCQKILARQAKYKYEILLELESSDKTELENALTRISELELEISLLNARQSDEFWKLREELPVILADRGADKLDICINAKAIDPFLADIDKLDASDIVYNFGHLGDGNIHVNILDDTDGGLSEAIYNLLQKYEGSPSAEHGIGKRKIHLLKKFTHYQDKQKLFKFLKKSVDPKKILGSKVFFE